MQSGPMSRDNLINVQMKRLKFLQRLGKFYKIRRGKVAKMLLKNRAGVKDLLFGEVNKDVVRIVRRPQKKCPDISVFEGKTSSVGVRRQSERQTWVTRKMFSCKIHGFSPTAFKCFCC